MNCLDHFSPYPILLHLLFCTPHSNTKRCFLWQSIYSPLPLLLHFVDCASTFPILTAKCDEGTKPPYILLPPIYAYSTAPVGLGGGCFHSSARIWKDGNPKGRLPSIALLLWCPFAPQPRLIIRRDGCPQPNHLSFSINRPLQRWLSSGGHCPSPLPLFIHLLLPFPHPSIGPSFESTPSHSSALLPAHSTCSFLPPSAKPKKKMKKKSPLLLFHLLRLSSTPNKQFSRCQKRRSIHSTNVIKKENGRRPSENCGEHEEEHCQPSSLFPLHFLPSSFLILPLLSIYCLPIAKHPQTQPQMEAGFSSHYNLT